MLHAVYDGDGQASLAFSQYGGFSFQSWHGDYVQIYFTSILATDAFVILSQIFHKYCRKLSSQSLSLVNAHPDKQ